VFIGNLLWSYWQGKVAGSDPWDAWTLEWSTPSPPPTYNFATIPEVRSRRPLWDLKHRKIPIAIRVRDCPNEHTIHNDARERYPMDLPARGPVGMYGLIAAEAAIFTIFVVAYVFNIGKSVSGPQPQDVLRVPIFFTICLLSSSLTIHFAVQLLRSGRIASFALWWLLTIALGAAFLFGTAREWRHRSTTKA